VARVGVVRGFGCGGRCGACLRVPGTEVGSGRESGQRQIFVGPLRTLAGSVALGGHAQTATRQPSIPVHASLWQLSLDDGVGGGTSEAGVAALFRRACEIRAAPRALGDVRSYIPPIRAPQLDRRRLMSAHGRAVPRGARPDVRDVLGARRPSCGWVKEYGRRRRRSQ
jgi:hypothetical protein